MSALRTSLRSFRPSVPLVFAYVALAWGGSFVAIKTGLGSVPPVLYAALRFDLGAAVLLALVAATGRRMRPRTRDDLAYVAVSGLLIVALNNGLLFVGQQHVTSGVASIVYSLSPVLATGLSRAFLPSERLDADELLGVALGLVGVVVIARPTPTALSTGTVGLGLIFLAATCVALGSVFTGRLSPSLGTASATAWSMAAGAASLHAWAFATGEGFAGAQFGPTVLAAVAYLGVFATAFAYLGYFTLLSEAGPVRANLVSYVVPAVATAAGAALLDERVTALTVAGFGVIVVGFVLLNRDRLSGRASRA